MYAQGDAGADAGAADAGASSSEGEQEVTDVDFEEVTDEESK